MDFSTIGKYILNHLEFVISVCVSVVFLVVNIIQAIRTKSISKLNDAILNVPQVIRDVEKIFQGKSPVEKKAAAEALLLSMFGDSYKKNAALFDEFIEEVLNTPEKKKGDSNGLS